MKVEERERDSWLDISLRQLREGRVRFYRVQDPATGEWLLKVCRDEEARRITVKALKCPPGKAFSQLEGSTMIFQESLMGGYYYDIVSSSYVDGEGRLRRRILQSLEEVPEAIRREYRIVGYEEATGKRAAGKEIVTLCKGEDERAMVSLFIVERAWPLSTVPSGLRAKAPDLLRLVRELERAEVEEVCGKAMEKYGLPREDVEALLRSLEDDGRILRLNGYVKAKA